MAAAPLRENEAASLAALMALGVLDSAAEAEFDALVRAAAAVCDMPISLLTLVDAKRQWFKANLGLPGVAQTDRELAFCAHAVLGDSLLEVPDASLDARFADNPFVTGEPGIRFYAGAPLRLDDGSRIGTLCVVDHRPRQLLASQRQVLQDLALVAARSLQGRQSAVAARQATLDLAASEARYRALSDSSPLGVFATDALGGCTYTNPRWQVIFGLTAEQALGQGWASSLHPLDRDVVLTAWHQAAARQEEFKLKFRILRPDGSVRAVHSRARAIPATPGSEPGCVGSVEDVTERQQIEAFLDRTGRVAGVGGWEVDLLSRETTWSKQTRLIHEVGPDYVPVLEAAINFYAPQARQEIAAAVQQGMDHGLPWDLELPLVTARGRQIWVRAQGDVEFQEGRPIRLTGAIQDVTEQRARRVELQQEHGLRLQLEQQVTETQALLRERSEMLDVMAHEVRQPLNNASAALQSAVRALGSPEQQSATPRLQRAQTVLARVLGSIDNTLAVASLLARPGPITCVYTDIDALVDVAMADVPMPERERLRVLRATSTRTASMDMSLMRLALRNLLMNALEYSPQGSTVELRLLDSDEPLALLIDVADRGPGIDPELLPRLFERGIHQGQARAALGQGLGLGLYIVRRVMELHGGKVRVLANSSQGVTMRLEVNQAHGD